ncbi:MAG: AAA family ATPase [Candidatus Heimdallarchaeota archaeon]|nr:AAA family ATPase [Candidatus Heimdallarchaeota archaeon]
MESLTCIYLKTLSQTSGENPRITILVDSDKKTFVVNLWSPWNSIGECIQPYTQLKMFNVEKKQDKDSLYYSAGSNSIVVVDPDILINATAVNNVSFCPRSYYLNEIVGETASPYIAIRGSIIHDSFGSAIANGSKPSEELSSIVDSFSLQFEKFGYTREDVNKELREMAESLDSFVEKLTGDSLPEILFLSPTFGIRGRIDLFNSGNIYELKTGKVHADDDIRFSDLLQITLYKYGLDDHLDLSKPSSGTVIYVGTNKAILKTAQPSWNLLRYAIEKRNIAYRVSYLGYNPPILPVDQVNRCNKCSVKHYCAMVCAGLNQERRCSTCPHDLLCTHDALPDAYQEYFNRFTGWIRAERNESAQNFSDLWKLDTAQRIEKGKAIDNLKLESEIKEDGSTKLIFSCENKSELREGDIIVLSKGSITKASVITGSISRITKNSLEITTRAVSESISVVDLYSLDVGFRRQQRGLFNLLFRRNNFREIILNDSPPSIVPVNGDFIKNNPNQNEGIERILGTKNFSLIQGPAGTGKTYVIAKTAIILAKNGEKILLTAFTNRAVDNICSYLLTNNFTNFIRLGQEHSTQNEIKDYTVDAYRSKYPDKSFSQLLSEIPIIVATTSTISNPNFEKLGIQTIIIDEASQMTEPTVLSALLEGDKFILVGDHKQLPPVVQSSKAQAEGMSVSLFERLAKLHPDSVHLLTHQFRMNEKLVEFSNNKFYSGKLQSFDNLVKLQNLLDLSNFIGDYTKLDDSIIYDPKSPLVYLPVKGVFQPDKKINKTEAESVGKIVKNFLKLGVNVNQIGIIGPYRGQVGEIRRHLPPNITVDTVDRFQGSDRELIILSLTESQSSGSRGFGDERRLNVAITRAKKKLVVVGDPQTDKGILGDYISYLNENAGVIYIKQPSKDVSKVIKDDNIIIAESLSKTARFLKKMLVKGKQFTESQESKFQCMVCFQPVYENAIECPFCEHFFHYTHLITWIRQAGRCPYCKTKLSIFKSN